MKVSELIEKRQEMWSELEALCQVADSPGSRFSAIHVARFASLYRSACADLALAESYQLPPATVGYLQVLVARAHNQLYRTRSFQWRIWGKRIFEDTPKMIFADPCVHLATLVFWGLFLISGFLAYNTQIWPGFAESVVGIEALEQCRDMYEGFGNRPAGANPSMSGFYIYHNASIGLSCFVMMLFILPGMVTLCFNAVYLGVVFGYMFRPETGEAGMNFRNFVTAHGPFELTAIVLSAAAGMRIGMGWMWTKGLSRNDSLIKAGREGLPIVMTAVVLFCLAAMIEGFVSPTTEQYLPWVFKGMVAWISSAVLMFYFVVLGYPRDREAAEPPKRQGGFDEA